MARHRMPVEVAMVTGADTSSPGRLRGRSAPVAKSLGVTLIFARSEDPLDRFTN